MEGAESENKSKARVDEECINFRPSPNFKHMKKYLKSKFEENQMSNPGAANGATDSPSSCHDEREKVNNKTSTKEVQPPLPPNPPPPDSPPIINLKKEIEDDEYQCDTSENASDFNQSEELMTDNIKTDQSEAVGKPELTMCRNFARGTCKKGASCIFAHVLILSQLPGVYTFCRNFQNSVCTLPKCKFVHATVFEKEYFFRTGYLPPHTLSHLKEASVMQPPPPPPPEEIPADVPQVFPTAPPHPPSQPCVGPVPIMNCTVSSTVETGDAHVYKPGITPAMMTSPKRDWSDSDEISSSPYDVDCSESLAKKCKNCDSSALRYQYAKHKLDKARRKRDEFRKTMARINACSNKLTAVLTAVMAQRMANAAKDFVSPFFVPEDDKFYQDKMNLPRGPTSARIPFIPEENKSLINILAKYISKNGQSIPPDT